MIPIGERVAIDEGSKTGTLRFLGPTQFRHGLWAGIELDQPLGKHDGTVQGVSYFDCPSNHGIFVHPSKVTRLLDHSNKNTHSNANHSVSNQHQNQNQEQLSFRGFHTSTILDDSLSRTPTRKRISLESGHKFLPFQTPIKNTQLPPSSILPSTAAPTTTKIEDQPDNAPREDSSVPTSSALIPIETELRKRHSAMQASKQALSIARMSITDPVHDYADYSDNRERLLGAVDLYERSVAKYERQVKRYHQALQKERMTSSSLSLFDSAENLSGPRPEPQALKKLQQEKENLLQERISLLDKIEKSAKRADLADDNCTLLEQQLEETKAMVNSAQHQLKQQSRIVAEINIDRMTLRKEVADLRGKLSALYEASSQGTDETDVLQLKEENSILKTQIEKQDYMISNLNVQGQDKTNMIDHTMEELEKALTETNETAQHLEATIKARDDEIARLKSQSSAIAELSEEVELLRKEKSLAAEQVVALQRKLIDYQDISQLDAAHRAQVESLRQNLEENWNRYQLELAERQAQIEDLQEQLSTGPMKRTPAPLNLEGLTVPDLAQKTLLALSELQHKYDELYQAKQKQEKYFTQQIAKLKKCHPPMDPLIEQPESPQKAFPGNSLVEEYRNNDLDTRAAELKNELGQLRSEKMKIEREKETEMYGFQLRLNRAMKERDEIKAKLDDLQGELRKNGPEVTILQREIEDLSLERGLLKKALAEDREKFKAAHADLIAAGEKMDAFKSQLNKRTEESVKLEVELKSMRQQMQVMEQTIEHAKREQLSKTRLYNTEREVLEKKISVLEEALALRKNDDIDRILKEKADLLESLGEARAEVEKLRASHQDVDYLRSKVRNLEEELAAKRDRLMELEVNSSVAKEELDNDIHSRDIYIRELEERLAASDSSGTFGRKSDASPLDPQSDKDLLHMQREIEQLRREKQELTLMAQRVSDNPSTLEAFEAVAALKKDLDREISLRTRAEKESLRTNDLLEIATKEMDSLQQKLAEFSDMDGQRKTLLVKYQTVKEEVRSLEERIANKDDMITKLQAKLVEKTEGSTAIHRGISMTSSIGEGLGATDKISGEAVKELEESRRMNANLEHEKRLLEEDLVKVKKSLKQLKVDSGVQQHQQLLDRAGKLIQEMVERQEESTWALMKPVKSLASFMRQFRPADVDLEKLRAEYESLRVSLTSGERSTVKFGDAVIQPLSPDAPMPLGLGEEDKDGSETDDPMGGFVLSALATDEDSTPFSG